MSTKSSASQCFYAKALVFVLLPCSAASVSAAEPIHDGAICASNAADTGCLKSTTADENKINFEERGILAEAAAFLNPKRAHFEPEVHENLLPKRQTDNVMSAFGENSDQTALIMELHLLLKKFKTEAALTDYLHELQKIDITKVKAAELLEAQIEQWKSVDKLTADKVFVLLKLDKTETTNLFKSPVFFQWEAFVTKTNPEPEVIGVMFNTLSNHYYQKGALAKALLEAPDIGDPESVASKLLDEQIRRWTRTYALESPTSTFKWLMLDKIEGNELFASPLFDRWFTGVMSASKQWKEWTFRVLHLNYESHAGLTEVLAAEKESGAMAYLAESLLEYQIEKWSGSSPEKVFKLLKLDLLNDKFFDGQAFLQWKAFVQKTYPKPEEAALGVMFRTLSSYYKEEALDKVLVAGAKKKNDIAKQLLRMRVMKGKLSGESNNDVGKLLELDTTSADRVEGPLTDVWNDFEELFKKKQLGCLRSLQNYIWR